MDASALNYEEAGDYRGSTTVMKQGDSLAVAVGKASCVVGGGSKPMRSD